jgi:hypothetical protein
MPRLLGLTCVMMFAFCVARAQSPKFLSYKKVEAYEIRPGILATPRYSVDGEVCEIGLERKHYSSEKIYLDSALSREEIDQIADEVAPINERGPRTKLMLGRDLIVEAGNTSQPSQTTRIFRSKPTAVSGLCLKSEELSQQMLPQ